MKTTAHIKFALQITLAIGCLSALLAMFGGLMYYADWVGKPQYPTPDLTPHFAQIDISSQDLDTLKRNWKNLAEGLDAQINFTHANQHFVDRVFAGFAWFAVVWGLVCGAALLYVHFLLRRVSKNNVL